ncbi:hypothetical protein Xmir_03915 [Xenorhabdus miraniensis]|uniref:Uncharacterized protein n=1 Tax=Xenorhabdus miraniensis TaxID=351674 RepID=A0A2D0JKG0_9GAMM|nr:hypothetical protein Xmir_03915 [Xenorhabdus miraniensis]
MIFLVINLILMAYNHLSTKKHRMVLNFQKLMINSSVFLFKINILFCFVLAN